jgi:hypothetical protein
VTVRVVEDFGSDVLIGLATRSLSTCFSDGVEGCRGKLGEIAMWRHAIAVVVGYGCIGVLVLLTDLEWAMAILGLRSMGMAPNVLFRRQLGD